jgi:hypothetical protein
VGRLHRSADSNGLRTLSALSSRSPRSTYDPPVPLYSGKPGHDSCRSSGHRVSDATGLVVRAGSCRHCKRPDVDLLPFRSAGPGLLGICGARATAAAYQRWRPPPRLPRSLPPNFLPPPPPSRGAIGRASFTVSGRPSKSTPLNFAMASAASFSVDISTKPKPLLRPVSRSTMTCADSTWPACVNISLRLSSLAENGRFPT